MVQCTLLWQPILYLEELKPPIRISNKIMQKLEMGSSVHNAYQTNPPRTEKSNVIKGDRKIKQIREGHNACEGWRNKAFSSLAEGE